MKIKNILLASALAFGLAFSLGDGSVMAKPDKIITFEEFAQDKAQFEKWEKEHIAHIKKIQELKDEKRIRRMEYKAFTHNPNAEPKLISKVARDIVMLDRQIKTLNQDFINTTREKYRVELFGFEFHKDFSPCFKPHYDHFGKPCGPMHDPKFDRPARHNFSDVPPHLKAVPPHHLKNDVPPHLRAVPPHGFYNEMPPHFDEGLPERPKAPKMKPEPEIDM